MRPGKAQRLDLVPVDEIAAGLARRADSLARELLPAGHYDAGKSIWRCGDAGGRVAGQSLCVWLSGAKAGQWFDFSAGEGGDLLGLIKTREGSIVAAIAWAKKWLGLPDNVVAARRMVSAAAVRRRPAAGSAVASAVAPIKSDLARALWARSVPAAGTIVETYLQGRGIFGPVPPTLRLAEKLAHPRAGFALPCMLAAVQGHDGTEFLTLHRTWLDLPGVKAAVLPVRMALGPYRGGAVRLTPAGETLAIGEGIETMLSVRDARPSWGCWSAVSLANIPNVWLPPCVRRLVICFDGDRPDSKAAKGGGRVRARVMQAIAAKGMGRRIAVEWAFPPVDLDFNDLAQQGAGMTGLPAE